MHDPPQVGGLESRSKSVYSIQRDLGRMKSGYNLVMEGQEKRVQSESKMSKQVPAGSMRFNLAASSVIGSRCQVS